MFTLELQLNWLGCDFFDTFSLFFSPSISFVCLKVDQNKKSKLFGLNVNHSVV